MRVKTMIMIAFSVVMIFVQEQLLVFIPNVQLTVLLILLFSSMFSIKESIIMIMVYVFIDSLYMGALNVFYMVPLFIAWTIIPLSYHTFLRRTDNEYKLAAFAFVFGFVFGWIFIPFRILELGITELWPYLLADIPFEAIMATTGFVTVIWLYKPLLNAVNIILEKETYIKQSSLK